MITMHKEDYERILAHARQEAPVETCGLIGGTIDGDDKHIERVYILTNIDPGQLAFTSGLSVASL